jgi:hypothetical protein
MFLSALHNMLQHMQHINLRAGQLYDFCFFTNIHADAIA